MKKIRVSVIGTGHAGRNFHIPGLSRFTDIDLSICDINEELLNSVGEQFNISPEKRYTDYKKMLTVENPQAVFVLMAQYPHGNYKPDIYFKIVNEVFEQKRDILVEKPLAMTHQEAAPLVEKAEKAGVITMCSFNRRFIPLVTFCKKEVEKKGPILNASCSFYKGVEPSPNSTWDWLTGDMIHALDLMRFLMKGEITDFFTSIGKVEDDEVPTAFYALARFDNGGTGIFSSNVRVGERIQSFEIHGIGISAFVISDPDNLDKKFMNATIFTKGNRPVLYHGYKMAGSDELSVYCGFTAADRYFIDCVKTRKQPHCNFADAYKTISYCHQILKNKLKTVKNV